MFQIPGMKKNLFSVANVVDAGHHILFEPNDVKFLRNLTSMEVDVIHTGKRVKKSFLYYLHLILMLTE